MLEDGGFKEIQNQYRITVYEDGGSQSQIRLVGEIVFIIAFPFGARVLLPTLPYPVSINSKKK